MFINYFKENKWWIIVFFIFVVTDAILTNLIITKGLGYEANPLISKMDWTFHAIRLTCCILIFILIASTNWNFTRNWLMQAMTLAYTWTILNNFTILFLGIDLGIYQFMPGYLYIMGFILQFSTGMGLLFIIRRIYDQYFKIYQ